MNYDTRHNPRQAVTADDGRTLPITTFEPASETRGVVLVVPAMATPSSYYAPLATHLAARGWRTVTFDYRGMGSRAEMKAEPADVDRWFADVRTILDAVADDADGLPVTWIGHSLGGQMVPFVDHTRLASVITVSAGDGYWRRNQPGVRWIAPFLWRVVAPLAIRVAGYYPGDRLNMVGDLPAGAMRQWGRWCLHPEYLQADHPEAPELFAEVKAPMMSLSFTDDELMSADSIRHLHDWYSNAALVRQRFSPDQLDGRRLGHHGFFRSANADLWEELLEPWLAS
ncbi:alpha/beta hydrolase family protein [Nocardioides antri]|uniref:Alpha/beta fold hydrolase n=1 Tax=Nocardioides antri TaxID=2607659 RepID=A0A5B1M7U3_9ACTN|nr:alpha/beta fold hydrolase [Nocardioides antri]KAA1427937.1 alpha/beta fold hydrolase [Nocardioides antri]